MKNLPQPKNREEAMKLIDEIRKERNENRSREMHLNARLQTMKGEPLVGSSDLGPNLLKVLPPHLAPKNVGQWGSIMWDFFYNVTIDFGANPVYGPNTRAENSFKVNQDGLMMFLFQFKTLEKEDSRLFLKLRCLFIRTLTFHVN